MLGAHHGGHYTASRVNTTNKRSFKPVYRLGVVSFLNARPLIAGLGEDSRVGLAYDVPARLSERLAGGEFDAALVPIVDVLASGGRYRVLSDSCIGSDGETMTVRVFSQVPPDRVHKLWVDGDSHTSVALAKLLWRALYDRELVLRKIDPRGQSVDEVESVLLIGDKVVNPGRGSFAYEVDLGGAWRQHTGLPFVFAVWATPSGRAPLPTDAARVARQRDGGEGAGEGSPARTVRGGLEGPALQETAQLLSAARDRGVADAAEIAARMGPQLGWPVELAKRYLTRCLKFKLDARCVEGANLFGRLCAQARIVAPDAAISWPESLLPRAVA